MHLQHHQPIAMMFRDKLTKNSYSSTATLELTMPGQYFYRKLPNGTRLVQGSILLE
jgi:hypothetical protein